MRNEDERRVLEEKYGGSEGVGFAEDCHRLALGEPVAYVIGWQPFLGLKIHLDSRPLIPRPETEWWAEQMLEKISSNIFEGSTARRREAQRFFSRKIRVLKNGDTDFKFLDLCAGSGSIGCAVLARFPNVKVFFGEIDPAHKATIRKNIEENGLDESRTSIGIGDLFEPFGDERFDFIAANPPYVPDDRPLPQSVEAHEPARALRSGTDGLALIRRIAQELPHHLARGGQAWVECDSPSAETASGLFRAIGMRPEIHTDQFGAPRLIVVHHHTNF